MNLEKSELIPKRSVRLHKDHLHESGRYVGKVEQRVKNTGNIIADILEDGCPFSDGELFFAAMVFRSAWLKALENGYGVDMFEMGTMYLAADDTFSEDAYVMGEDEKKNMPRLTARFSVSKLAKEAAAKVQIDADDIRRADSLPFIENITNWREKKARRAFYRRCCGNYWHELKDCGKRRWRVFCTCAGRRLENKRREQVAQSRKA